VVYPGRVDEDLNRQRVTDCLREAGLGDLVEELDWEDDWGRRLSRGEAQRIGIARVLFHAPEVGQLSSYLVVVVVMVIVVVVE